MSKRKEFVRQVKSIVASKPVYRIGGSGTDGTCDCVGLCIGALKRMGIPYKGEHSSNWVPRREAVELWRITSTADLSIGDAVLKAREPGEPKYNLPSRFQSYNDIRDYYHIGVVTSVNPLEITHMTSPTAQADTTLGAWRYGFLFRQLQEGGGEDMPEETQAICRAVVITKVDPLRIQRAPETGEVIGHAPIGAAVDVLEDGDWAKIRWNGVIGYASRAFLRYEFEDDELPEEADVTTLIEESTGQVIRLIGRWHEEKD